MSAAKRAPGPYSYDDDEDYVPTKTVKYSAADDQPKKVKKHSLDSDEEDENEDEENKAIDDKNYTLNEDDLDGQEDGTVDFEGETQITPFNMKEEMEEGHFDRDGFYHFKKEDAIKDAWLEDIDWVKVKHREGDDKKYGSDIESDDSDDAIANPNKVDSNIKIYTEILEFLKPGETIAKSLKRLGGNKKMSSAQRWKLKKSGNLQDKGQDQNMIDFLKLTELANNVMATGNMDIYQETYEMINLKIQKANAPKSEPEMDMFADEGDDKKENNTKNSDETMDTKSSNDEAGETGIGELMWELRWTNVDDAEIHGPFPNEKMVQWQETGYFEKGAYVRKADQGGQWYTTKRIDFELYS